MEIVPDTKDWTWVLQRPCPECGVDTRQIKRDSIPRMLRECAAEWVTLLHQTEHIRERPAPTIWSPLEYACHVRDVFRVFDERLRRMIVEEEPHYPNWNQNVTATEERYEEQDPATVSDELREAADRLAARFEGVKGDQWQRTGRRSDGAQFTIETFARYLLHDPLHHLYDVTGRRYDKNAEPA